MEEDDCESKSSDTVAPFGEQNTDSNSALYLEDDSINTVCDEDLIPAPLTITNSYKSRVGVSSSQCKVVNSRGNSTAVLATSPRDGKFTVKLSLFFESNREPGISGGGENVDQWEA